MKKKYIIAMKHTDGNNSIAVGWENLFMLLILRISTSI
jgi:hypothetical protein